MGDALRTGARADVPLIIFIESAARGSCISCALREWEVYAFSRFIRGANSSRKQTRAFSTYRLSVAKTPKGNSRKTGKYTPFPLIIYGAKSSRKQARAVSLRTYLRRDTQKRPVKVKSIRRLRPNLAEVPKVHGNRPAPFSTAQLICGVTPKKRPVENGKYTSRVPDFSRGSKSSRKQTRAAFWPPNLSEAHRPGSRF